MPTTGPPTQPAGIDRWLAFCNQTRPHQALDNRTPADVYSAANGQVRAWTHDPRGRLPSTLTICR